MSRTLSSFISDFAALVGAVSAALFAQAVLPQLQPQVPAPTQASRSVKLKPLESLENMGELVSLHIHRTDIVEFSTSGTPDTQAADDALNDQTPAMLVARGECVLATDMHAVRIDASLLDRHALHLHLKTPQLLSARINRAPRERGGSYIYTLARNGGEHFVPWSDKQEHATDLAYAKAQNELEAACKTPETISEAERNAEDTLRSMLSAQQLQAEFSWES